MFKKKKGKTAKKGSLSFGDNEDEDAQRDSSVNTPQLSRSCTPDDRTRTLTPATEGEDSIPIKKRLAANTNVGFQAKSMSKAAMLRDAQTKEQLRKDFLAMQESVKATDFVLPFVFYAGKDISGGVCRMKKGDLVWLFLDRARKVGAEVSSSDRSKREWARVSVDDLMLVRGDIIVPHVRTTTPLRSRYTNLASIMTFTTSWPTRASDMQVRYSHTLQNPHRRARWTCQFQ